MVVIKINPAIIFRNSIAHRISIAVSDNPLITPSIRTVFPIVGVVFPIIWAIFPVIWAVLPVIRAAVPILCHGSSGQDNPEEYGHVFHSIRAHALTPWIIAANSGDVATPNARNKRREERASGDCRERT